ncbi:uncharacterized protein LOC101846375 [Aplysia californica]|uniref:Uncharacterized protein LOC101846375 n=1 Tax=Aplysia californica TaxID=6500 RepID=A0ABM1VYA2_APLCA|nr:uncharacterized protein LOC101846375 [Aplysia californica]
MGRLFMYAGYLPVDFFPGTRSGGEGGSSKTAPGHTLKPSPLTTMAVAASTMIFIVIVIGVLCLHEALRCMRSRNLSTSQTASEDVEDAKEQEGKAQKEGENYVREGATMSSGYPEVESCRFVASPALAKRLPGHKGQGDKVSLERDDEVGVTTEMSQKEDSEDTNTAQKQGYSDVKLLTQPGKPNDGRSLAGVGEKSTNQMQEPHSDLAGSGCCR